MTLGSDFYFRKIISDSRANKTQDKWMRDGFSVDKVRSGLIRPLQCDPENDNGGKLFNSLKENLGISTRESSLFRGQEVTEKKACLLSAVVT